MKNKILKIKKYYFKIFFNKNNIKNNSYYVILDMFKNVV